MSSTAAFGIWVTMLPSVLATQAMGLLNGVAPALVVAAGHLARGPLAASISQRRGITSSTTPAPEGKAATSFKPAASSFKIKPGLRSFAAQPALETDMFCYQVCSPLPKRRTGIASHSKLFRPSTLLLLLARMYAGPTACSRAQLLTNMPGGITCVTHP